MDYDVLVVGSGFGGSVAALRLSQKGYRVGVLEMGRRIGSAEMESARHSFRKLFWMPALGLRGFFVQRFFKHATIVGGVGVGGGSLVYAAVLLAPGPEVFKAPPWDGLGLDWAAELRPHFAEAGRMLGVETFRGVERQDEALRACAQEMGAGSTWGQVPLGIYIGEPGVRVADPYFGGQGPARTGCRLCGACLAGCPYEAKNTLDQNYLYLAEKLGAQILPQRKVTTIRPLPGGGYELAMIDPLNPWHSYAPLSARRVILAAGVLGTLELLFRCRDEAHTLPLLSDQLGRSVRTNSEAVVGVLARDEGIDLTRGPAISSDFYPNSATHITQNRLPESYSFMKAYSGPLVDGHQPGRRALRVLGEFLRHPRASTYSFRARNWYKRATLLTVMQNLDNQLRFRYAPGPLGGLRSETDSGQSAPAYLPLANQAARAYARAIDGVPLNSLLESTLNMSVTAHILGGCVVAATPQQGVVDTRHEVFAYPGLYVLDGSAVPGNVGVNPSLTITALAERAASLIPDKE